jgi:hypothetical protein
MRGNQRHREVSLIKGIILEGICNVNVMCARSRRATMLSNMKEGNTYQPSGEYRPLTPHQKKMHKIRHEPRKYEYLPLPQAMQEQQARDLREGEPEGFGLLLLGLLNALSSLPENDVSGIDGGQEWQTPQSSLIGRS